MRCASGSCPGNYAEDNEIRIPGEIRVGTRGGIRRAKFETAGLADHLLELQTSSHRSRKCTHRRNTYGKQQGKGQPSMGVTNMRNGTEHLRKVPFRSVPHTKMLNVLKCNVTSLMTRIPLRSHNRLSFVNLLILLSPPPSASFFCRGHITSE